MRVTFFTREQGVLNCFYKGGRTPKKHAILQPFMPLWLALDVRQDSYFVRQLEAQSGALVLQGNSLFAGLYVNELLFHLLSPMDSHPQLFAVYLHTLQGLATVTDKLALAMLLRRFEMALLSACGYSICFTHEARLVIPISDQQCYQFIADEGFVLADTGIPGEAILALAQGQFAKPNVLKVAKLIMREAIDHLLEGRELKSRALLMTPRHHAPITAYSHESK